MIPKYKEKRVQKYVYIYLITEPSWPEIFYYYDVRTYSKLNAT